MIVPDANLLIYAHDEASPHHAKAKAWWENALSGTEPVGLVWVVVLAFTRLLTHPTLSEHPLSIPEVRAMVEQWMASPAVRLIGLSDQALPRFFDLLAAAISRRMRSSPCTPWSTRPRSTPRTAILTVSPA